MGTMPWRVLLDHRKGHRESSQSQCLADCTHVSVQVTYFESPACPAPPFACLHGQKSEGARQTGKSGRDRLQGGDRDKR